MTSEKSGLKSIEQLENLSKDFVSGIIEDSYHDYEKDFIINHYILKMRKIMEKKLGKDPIAEIRIMDNGEISLKFDNVFSTTSKNNLFDLMSKHKPHVIIELLSSKTVETFNSNLEYLNT